MTTTHTHHVTYTIPTSAAFVFPRHTTIYTGALDDTAAWNVEGADPDLTTGRARRIIGSISDALTVDQDVVEVTRAAVTVDDDECPSVVFTATVTTTDDWADTPDPLFAAGPAGVRLSEELSAYDARWTVDVDEEGAEITARVIQDDPTDRVVVFYVTPTVAGIPHPVRYAHWEYRGEGFPTRLYLRDLKGVEHLVDPDSALVPAAVRAWAPDFEGRARDLHDGADR